MFADDHGPHKTEAVRKLCWSRGYIIIIHGGGCTPVLQTPDTELNQRVRRKYHEQESQLLAERMSLGATTPSLTPEECMWVMLNVLKDPKLHVDIQAEEVCLHMTERKQYRVY